MTLAAAEVRKSGKRLLGPVDLTLQPTGFTIVMGPNGAGKSTLLKTLHGMERLRRGQRSWAVAQDIALARQAFVFQTPVVLRRSVLDNVAYPLTLRGTAKREAQAAARRWLDVVGLSEAAAQRASDLSGGERQKMALARALITEPDGLLLDEPCANLDGQATREIETLLLNAHKNGMRIVMATHDLGQARRLATDVVFLHKGALIEHRPAPQFFQSPTSSQASAFLAGDIVE
jgi:tungstate transport system ATP-binding protein